MVLTGETVTIGGDVQRFRGTWTPLEGGHVRQFLETSNDGGETWTVWFDGLYVPHGSGPPSR